MHCNNTRKSINISAKVEHNVFVFLWVFLRGEKQTKSHWEDAGWKLERHLCGACFWTLSAWTGGIRSVETFCLSATQSRTHTRN